MPGAASEQAVTAAEPALFAQDRWRIGSRVTLELGLRIDREDIIQRVNFSPRGGVSVACPKAGQSSGAVWGDSGSGRRSMSAHSANSRSARSRVSGPMGIRPVRQ